MTMYVLQKDMEGNDLKAGDFFTVMEGKVYLLYETYYEPEFIENTPRLFKLKENESNSIGLHIQQV